MFTSRVGAIHHRFGANFNFHEPGALPSCVLSLERGQRRPARGKSQATNYGRVRAGERKRERERDIHGVIRFLANYSRVPLTSPICLDYERRARPSSLRSAPSSHPADRFKALLSRRCSTRFLPLSFFVSFFSHRLLDIASCCETVRMDRTMSTGVSLILLPSFFRFSFFLSFFLMRVRDSSRIRIDLRAVQIGFIRTPFLVMYDDR